jgi:hypothetical protein
VPAVPLSQVDRALSFDLSRLVSRELDNQSGPDTSPSQSAHVVLEAAKSISSGKTLDDTNALAVAATAEALQRKTPGSQNAAVELLQTLSGQIRDVSKDPGMGCVAHSGTHPW